MDIHYLIHRTETELNKSTLLVTFITEPKSTRSRQLIHWVLRCENLWCSGYYPVCNWMSLLKYSLNYKKKEVTSRNGFLLLFPLFSYLFLWNLSLIEKSLPLQMQTFFCRIFLLKKETKKETNFQENENIRISKINILNNQLTNEFINELANYFSFHLFYLFK